MTSFGEFIKLEREKRGWTQTDLGAKLSINMTKISRIENNKDLFNSTKLNLLSTIFEIDIVKLKDLFYGDKFAKEAYKNGCSERTFQVAEKSVEYLKSKNVKQAKLKF